ncbi:MAG: tRNA (adenosine(37)-N6)-threonylcarbamoyltransferase complex dimerization subunit type 1 TsaB [Chloroflexota bacterium]|nr:tRNA (adenosine(37)-N6)-threonylcarbamoyltransferase complex dimerization subunit type 1 TsaB [Anaerolineales bacterium]
MLLAVDTSTAQVGLALYDGSQVVSEYAWRSSQRHTVELAPAVAELLARSSLTMDNVQALGVALGPGSFTSLRVGLSLVKGLALARHLPLVGIPTLDILAAAQAPSRLPLAVAIQAGRGRFALGWYKRSSPRDKRSKNGWQAKGPARVVTVQTLIEEITRPVILCGEFTYAERQKLSAEPEIQLVSPAKSVRRPALLAELAWQRWQTGDVDDDATLAPIYLHVAEPIPS